MEKLHFSNKQFFIIEINNFHMVSLEAPCIGILQMYSLNYNIHNLPLAYYNIDGI
jgi:hypothetical protein